MTVLSVNINKIAVLRNSRGGDMPSVMQAAEACLAAGCGGITVHPRPDLRHIRPADVRALGGFLAGTQAEFNIEGNPFADARGEYPGLLRLCAETSPAQATLVPDGDGQITSDHGFDLKRDGARLKPLVRELKAMGCRVSLFMDADSDDIERVAELGADRIEIYTGPFAESFALGDWQQALEDCAKAAGRAQAAGLGVNAGHDLNQVNLGPFLRAVPQVDEVSIGHALIGEALYDGLAPTVRNYLAVIAAARS
ncbi:pyridoxine 5'-phosphate synthase [Chitinimonas prasina]|uniref:Pyridoxine 5'-phosphate synthase n=1 Tax=Chitinimonas prasina TaxID=1434937 RepID=A0ABQ5YL74_9NEIS|nr:pyridoxine 5'-phosphate synthase [Chitinimonas prasina]GLR14472.1 pyridoxine 5'-phosphate synthase [Chitinimonas prasina]